MIHAPVLLKEVIDILDLCPGMFVVDGTVDGGGHAEAILEKIGPKGKLLGIDEDEHLLARCMARLQRYKNFVPLHGNYADLPPILEKRNLGKADALLLDLGFSSEQLGLGRGFSFEKDEPLLMTYSSNREPVKSILKRMHWRELAKIIFDLSGEKFAARIAKAITERIRSKPIATTKDLRDAVLRAVPGGYERGRIDPATRTFQALRIYANDELGSAEKAMANIPRVLKPRGRIAVISFHSLEDKIVKNSFKDLARKGILEILTKKPITASSAEIISNPRSRSAKLRAAKIK